MRKCSTQRGASLAVFGHHHIVLGGGFMDGPGRIAWILGVLAGLAIAWIGFSWMIQGAWLASFPDRHGEMNPAMWIRSLVFVGGLGASGYCVYRMLRK
jgi:hypothetical protein